MAEPHIGNNHDYFQKAYTVREENTAPLMAIPVYGLESENYIQLNMDCVIVVLCHEVLHVSQRGAKMRPNRHESADHAGDHIDGFNSFQVSKD